MEISKFKCWADKNKGKGKGNLLQLGLGVSPVAEFGSLNCSGGGGGSLYGIGTD